MELILASIADDLGRSGSFCCVWHGESVLAIPTDLIPKVFGSFQQYRPETGRLESSSAQMELGALAHSRLSMSQQLAGWEYNRPTASRAVLVGAQPGDRGK